MPTSVSGLVTTRESLHRLAEHVVSPCRYAATGRIGLRPHPCGLRTPPFGDADTVVAVELDELVVTDATGTRRTQVRTLREAGAFVGVTPGAPASVYTPATPCELDAPLSLDVCDMRSLAAWYALGDDALSRLAHDCAGESPAEAQLWPEHLDLATSVSDVNFGFSPGDAHTPEPYAYVGPYSGRPHVDAFWNVEYGALRTAQQIPDATAAVAFFHEARARLAVLPLGNERSTS